MILYRLLIYDSKAWRFVLIMNHLSGPGKAIGHLCVCVCVCLLITFKLNDMTFDLDI